MKLDINRKICMLPNVKTYYYTYPYSVKNSSQSSLLTYRFYLLHFLICVYLFLEKTYLYHFSTTFFNTFHNYVANNSTLNLIQYLRRQITTIIYILILFEILKYYINRLKILLSILHTE